MRGLLVTCLLALLLIGAACAREPAQPPLVLIIIDTLRADHTSLHGYERDTTPRLRELAADAAVFERAFTTASWTLPGVASILTGQWPSAHGAGLSGTSRIRDDVTTLPEALAAAGYTTGAIANGGFLHEGFGLDRGFDSYDFVAATDAEIRRADVSVDTALRWIDARGNEPYFLMLHVFDVHRFYDAPPPVRGTYTEAFRDRYGDTLATLESRIEAEQRGDLEFDIAAYDEEILWTDGEIGRFLDGLRDRGVLDRGRVVLTADHGEAFFEHGVKAHGMSLHNEVLRVPLVIWGADIPAGRYLQPVSTVDVAPSLAAAAGVELPAGPGIPLTRTTSNATPDTRLIFAQNHLLKTNLSVAIRWPLKLIQDTENEATFLYDLSTDPGETTNLVDEDDAQIMRVVRALRREARDLRTGVAGEQVELDPRLREQLRALGYIQ